MRRSATRLLIVTLMGFLLALPGVASAMAESAADVQAPITTEPVPPTTTAPVGPELDQQETEADRAERNRKLVMGGVSVVLVAVVVWGRSIRRKRRKAADG